MTLSLVLALAALGCLLLAAGGPAPALRRVPRPAAGEGEGAPRRMRADTARAAAEATTGGWTRMLRAGRALGVPQAPPGLACRLDAAGVDDRRPVGDVMALKVAAAAGGLLFALPLLVAQPGRLGLLLAAAGPAAGFLGPDAVLGVLARRRVRAVEIELPDVVDLLRVAVDAGLPVLGALAAAAGHSRGVLAAELRAVAALVTLGEPRDEVLHRLRRRCPLPEVAALAAILTRAGQHGTPPGPALHALAADARARRARRLREDAGRAAPKIQLVVALLLVPAVLLLVAAGLARGLV